MTNFSLRPLLQIVGVTVFVASYLEISFAQPPMPPATVRVEKVLKEKVPPTRDFFGTVYPSQKSMVGSAVDGRVVEYSVDSGQSVMKDQPLAQLLVGTISIEIDGAKAEKRLREAELEELQAGARPEEIAQAEAQLAASVALEAYAVSRLERTRQLAKAGGAISTEELELAVSQYRSAEQRKIEFEESLRLLKAGPRKEQIAQAQARLDVQTEQVNLLEDRGKKYTLNALFDGYVVREYTEVGAWVKQGDPIAEVVNIDPVEIEVGVPEGTIRFLRRDLDVLVRVDAIGGKLLPGTISQIVPEADQRARTFPVKVRVANKPDSEELLIRPGMLAKVTLPTSDPVEGLTISKDAAVFRGESATIYKAVDGKAVLVPIKIIASYGDRYLVEAEGLKVDDIVVNRGNERVRPGQPLLIQDAKEAE